MSLIAPNIASPSHPGINRNHFMMRRCDFWCDAHAEQNSAPFNQISGEAGTYENGASRGWANPYRAFEFDGANDTVEFDSYTVVPAGTTKLGVWLRFYVDSLPATNTFEPYFQCTDADDDGWLTWSVAARNVSGTDYIEWGFHNNPKWPHLRYSGLEAGKWYDTFCRWERSAGTSADFRVWLNGRPISPTFTANSYDSSMTLSGHDRWGLGAQFRNNGSDQNYAHGHVASAGLWVGNNLPGLGEINEFVNDPDAVYRPSRVSPVWLDTEAAAVETGGLPSGLSLLGVGA